MSVELSETAVPEVQAAQPAAREQTKALAGNASLVSPEYVAAYFLKKLAAGRYRIIPGFSNQLIMWANDKIPSVSRWVIDSELRKFWRKTRSAKKTALSTV